MQNPTPSSRPRLEAFAGLALMLALATPFRAFLESGGVSGQAFRRNDEGHYVPRVMGFLQGEWGDFNFINPTLSLHLFHGATVVWGWWLVLIGRFESFEQFAAEAASNPSHVTLAARFLSISASVAAVSILYLIARRMFSAPVALLAGAAFAVNRTHAQRAPLAGSESLMVLFVLLCFLAILRYLREPSARRHALAGLLLGVAAATKYNAGIQVVTLVAASGLALASVRSAGASWGVVRQPRYWAGFVAAPLAFAAASPFAIVHFGEFVSEFGGQVTDFMGAGMKGIQEQESGWSFYVLDFPQSNAGLAFALLCALGVVAAGYRALVARDRRAVLLLAASLPCYLTLGSGLFHQMRFLLPSIPFLLVLGAWALGGSLSWATTKLVPESRAGLRSGLTALLVLGLGAWALLPSALETYERNAARFGRPDPRGELLTWLGGELAPGEPCVTYLHPAKLSPLTLEPRRGKWRELQADDEHLTPLEDLALASATLDDLRHELAGRQKLLVAIRSFASFLPQDGQVGELIADTLAYSERLKDLPYRDELGAYLADLARASAAAGRTRVERENGKRDQIMVVGVLDLSQD